MGGKRLQSCNLTETEQEQVWKEFDEGLLTREELDRVAEILPQYLFYYSGNRGKERECTCTNVDCGKWYEKKQ